MTPLRFRTSVRSGIARLRGGRSGGQSIVEMALVLPLLLILLMGLIEFALAFNATLAINTASQNGALMASEAGNQSDADCLILRGIEADVQAPASRSAIVEVQIQWTSPSGSAIRAKNRYTRGGSMPCVPITGSLFTVPYTRVESGYMEAQRCNTVAGCPALTPAHTSVDTVGVQIRYDYTWRTPLGTLMQAFLGGGNNSVGYTFQKRNIFRLEPIL